MAHTVIWARQFVGSKPAEAGVGTVAEMVVEGADQTINVVSSNDKAKEITVLLNDEIVDLDQPVTIRANQKEILTGHIDRTIAALNRSVLQRFDPTLCFSSSVSVRLNDE